MRLSKKFFLSTLSFVSWLLITFIDIGIDFAYWCFDALIDSIFGIF